MAGLRLQMAVSRLSITGGQGDPSTPRIGPAAGASPWFEVVNGVADVLAERRVIYTGAAVGKVGRPGTC
ncbi:MAG: hypothetical protein M0Z54_11500 [Thermaerobacter sp.]|nr:hypothetical protein [Thermaerobacter sp.]